MLEASSKVPSWFISYTSDLGRVWALVGLLCVGLDVWLIFYGAEFGLALGSIFLPLSLGYVLTGFWRWRFPHHFEANRPWFLR